MKKMLLLAVMLAVPTLVLMADNTEVPVKFRNGNGSGNLGNVEHAPMRMPVWVSYDEDNRNLVFMWDCDLVCAVSLYDSEGGLRAWCYGLQPTIDCSGYPAGTYTLLLEGDSWTGTGEFEIK